MTDNITSNVPELTRDLTRAKADLDDFGYCIIADAMTALALETSRVRLEEQAEVERQQGLAYHDSGGCNQRLWMLANKGECFRDMIVDPLTDELVGHVLGKQFILNGFTANIAKNGGGRMGLHTDQWWMPQPVRPGLNYLRPSEISRIPAPEFINPDTTLGIAPPVVCNTMWMLSDFTLNNGATEFVPGSHLSGAHPHPSEQSDYPIVQATAPAGSLVVFDGRIWHGTGAHSGGGDRLGVLANYSGPQIRQQENQTLGIDPDLWESLADKLKARLGFQPWSGYGRIESPLDPMVSPRPKRIGELKPD